LCTVVILFRPEHDWPVLIAANRDERRDRPWRAPGAHWPDRPGVIGGIDLLAGGSWLGINDVGLVAAILNRQGALGPEAGKRSRGELVLDALDFADAAEAATALSGLDPLAYRPFNLLIADNRDALLVIHRDGGGRTPMAVRPLPEGLTMITSLEPDDPNSARIRFHRPRFAAAPPPDPSRDDWLSWRTLLGSREREEGGGPSSALFIDPIPAGDPGGFGTVSSSLIALPAIARPAGNPIWRFASGTPENWRWEDVALGTRN
jgi:hypothetical protein